MAVLVGISLTMNYWPIVLPAAGAYLAYRIVREYRMKKYFASDEFLAHKEEIRDVVKEHNDISEYIGEVRQNGTFSIGASTTGSTAHLATSTNTSKHRYRRDRNIADYSNTNVHNASLQVVRNASAKPIEALIKYFNVEVSDQGLAEVESLGESISRLENAVENLESRESAIEHDFAPPKFITKHYLKKFQEQVGLEISAVTIPYPVYKFQYVSAGGNSSQETTVKLNSTAIDALIQKIAEKVTFRKSAAGQRALMTATLRDKIKTRDSYTCRICAISVSAEPHLLLEVDHIMPVSKGGLSTEENLQTLCWRCNRSKSNKIVS